MSRIGKHPIAVPAGVEVKVDGSTVTVKGPKGSLTKEFHKDMIRIHKSYEALKSGSVLYLHGGHKILCYGRFTDNKQVVVIMNTNYEDVDLKLHIRQIGVYNHSILRRVMLTNEEGYTLEPQDFMVEHNVLTIKAPKMSAMVLVRA